MLIGDIKNVKGFSKNSIHQNIIEFEGVSYVDNDNRNFISIQTADGFGIYSKSGADAILIHSKDKNAKKVFAFAKKFSKSKNFKPMVAVPSTYSKTKEIEFFFN